MIHMTDDGSMYHSADECGEWCGMDKKEQFIQHPETGEFLRGALVEAAYQREKRNNQDKGKTNADWFWTLGYIVGKSLPSEVDNEHTLHYIEAGAALLANWHAAIKAKTETSIPQHPLIFKMPACLKHFFKGYKWWCKKCDEEVERQMREVVHALWIAQGAEDRIVRDE